MKQIFLKGCLALTLCTYAFFSEAQIEKGMKLINGNGYFSTGSSGQQDSLYHSKYTSTNVSFAPSLGIFLSDKICVGLSVPLSYQKSTSNGKAILLNVTNASKVITLRYGVSPYIRYYKNFSEKFYGFVNAGAGFYLLNGKEYITNSAASDFVRTRTGYGFSSGINFGLTYFVTPRLALESSLVGVSYNSNYTKREEVSYENYVKENSFSVNYFPSGINLGLSFFIK